MNDLKQNFQIYSHNVCGLKTQINEFYHESVLSNEFHVLTLTETWLYNGNFDNELFDSRYSVWLADRPGDSRGRREAAFLAIPSSLQSRIIRVYSFQHINLYFINYSL